MLWPGSLSTSTSAKILKQYFKLDLRSWYIYLHIAYFWDIEGLEPQLSFLQILFINQPIDVIFARDIDRIQFRKTRACYGAVCFSFAQDPLITFCKQDKKNMFTDEIVLNDTRNLPGKLTEKDDLDQHDILG